MVVPEGQAENQKEIDDMEMDLIGETARVQITDLDDLDPAVAGAVRQASIIVTPSGDGTQPSLEMSRQVAIALAKLSGARLYLVDRVGVTWGDTPHCDKPADRDTLAKVGAQAAHMIPQMDEAIAAGVAVWAWRSSLPGIGNYEDAVDNLGADLAVGPASIEKLGLTERFHRRGPSERRHDRRPAVHMVVVELDGSIRLL